MLTLFNFQTKAKIYVGSRESNNLSLLSIGNVIKYVVDTTFPWTPRIANEWPNHGKGYQENKYTQMKAI